MVPETSGSLTSITLIDRIRQDDADAWRRLIYLYGPLVHGWCCSCGLREDDAADIGQEVFRAVARSVGNFRRDRPSDTFRGWLRTITKNKIRDFYQREARQPSADGGTHHHQMLTQWPMEDPTASGDGSAASELDQVYRRALELIRTDFAEQTWKAFWRTAVDGVATAVVAAEMGMTTTAVRKAKSRVLQRLRTELVDPLDLNDRSESRSST